MYIDICVFKQDPYEVLNEKSIELYGMPKM